MEILPIHTENDYKIALCEVSAYFDSEPAPGTPDGDGFEVLLTLVETYETKHYPIDFPTPVEAIKFRMEQAGLSPKDLVPSIGRLNRVFEDTHPQAASDTQDPEAARKILDSCGKSDLSDVRGLDLVQYRRG